VSFSLASLFHRRAEQMLDQCVHEGVEIAERVARSAATSRRRPRATMRGYRRTVIYAPHATAAQKARSVERVFSFRAGDFYGDW
jgi:hypothetical protein